MRREIDASSTDGELDRWDLEVNKHDDWSIFLWGLRAAKKKAAENPKAHLLIPKPRRL